MTFNINLNSNPISEKPVVKQEKAVVDFETRYDLLIIGGGPAALNAAIYAKRKGLSPAIIAERLGGQIMDTSEVDNYLGLPGASGFDLAMRFIDHAKLLGIPMLEGVRVNAYERGDRIIDESMNVLFEQGDHILKLSDGRQLRGRSVLLATGSTPRHLNVPGEDLLQGRGVSYCAICDGFFFRGKSVVIAGGGNAAIEAAIDMAKIASEVTVVQRSHYRADKVLLEQVDKLANVRRIEQTDITEILGEEKVLGIKVYDKKQKLAYELETSAVFVEIGHIPNPGPFAELVERNDFAEVVVDARHQTSLPGVYAAGDVTQEPFKQIIVAAAAGASAALTINQDLNRLSAISVDHTMSQMIMAERV